MLLPRASARPIECWFRCFARRQHHLSLRLPALPSRQPRAIALHKLAKCFSFNSPALVLSASKRRIHDSRLVCSFPLRRGLVRWVALWRSPQGQDRICRKEGSDCRCRGKFPRATYPPQARTRLPVVKRERGAIDKGKQRRRIPNALLSPLPLCSRCGERRPFHLRRRPSSCG